MTSCLALKKPSAWKIAWETQHQNSNGKVPRKKKDGPAWVYEEKSDFYWVLSTRQSDRPHR